MPLPVKSKPRWTRRKEARPQELLDAALDLFVERGYAATRLEDVAAQAGVSKGTLYLYFANKEDLFKAVVRENLVPVLDEAQGLIDQYQGTSAQLFRDFILGWWKRIGDTKLSGITKLMLAESGNFPELAHFYHEEVISRSNTIIIRMLERGIARGEFRKIDTVNANMVIVSPIMMLMMWRHSFGASQSTPISPLDFLNTFIDLISHGLLVNPGPGLTEPTC
ncbi:MAG: TetR/AcrR family transcriptional regulator [Herminiimonas sp.]|nr:TetR/AcrR family transcriptional regulator [Herminiimonas sp.]